MRLKDPNESATRGLEAVLYHVSFAEDKEGKDLLRGHLLTHYHTIEILYKCGFKTPIQEEKVCKNIDEAIEFINLWEKTPHF